MTVAFSTRDTRAALVAGILVALLIGLIGFLQWDTAKWEGALRRRAQHSSERSQAIGDYLSSLRDIETGQRGFLVTSDPMFLQPFNRGISELPNRKQRLRALFADSPQKKNDVERLIALGSARTIRASGTVSMMKAGRWEEARARISEGTGKRLMDMVRMRAARMESQEDSSARALLESTIKERSRRQKSIFLLEFAAILSLGLLLLALTRTINNLKAVSRTLRDAAARQTAIFEGASDAMMMLDRVGTIESANSAAERLFGRPRSDIIGQSNLILFNNPPSPEVSRAYLDRLADGKVLESTQIFEGMRGNGSTLEAEVVTTPIHLEDGLHFLAIARDATERRQVARMKDEFVATVSHELRTPLTSIAGSLGLLLGGAAGELTDKAKRLVQIAHTNCERLIRLINEMLDIEKIESGQIVLNLRDVPVAQAIEQAFASLSALAEDRRIRLTSSPVPRDLHVRADADRLMQILTNLLSNAIKFSPDDGQVELLTDYSRANVVRVSVRDFGPGIPPEFRARIFQKFAQADATDSRQKGGTGLGLSIVRELVTRMGGEVDYESVVGEGSVFSFTLPAASVGTPDLPAQLLGRIGEEGTSQVLHIDDDPDTLRLVASALDGRASVHSSPSLFEAKASLQRYDFDAVILDIAMPDGNGLEIIDLVSARGATPIILYTALDEDVGGEPEVYARLTKSKATLRELVTVVERAIRPKESQP